MEEKKIVLLRLYGGELIIGETSRDPDSIAIDSNTVVLENPRTIHMVPTMDGSVGMVVRPVCDPFAVERLKKRIDINLTQVMFTLDENEIDSELLNGYRSEVSGIRIASPGEAAALASSGKFEI